MEELKFCPKCGHESLLYNGISKLTCGNCDFQLYSNCAAAVAVLIKFENKYLFTRRNQEPKKGFLDLAGGFTDPEESAEETCSREIFEELNLKIDASNLKYLGSQPNTYLYKNITYNTLDLFFLQEIEGLSNFNLEETEISEIVWLEKEEINLEELAFDSQKKFLSTYLK